MEETPAPRPWLSGFEHRDQQFADSCIAMRERILKDGAIPAKYKLAASDDRMIPPPEVAGA